MNYEKINNEIKKFVEERDWDQFHSPKNLSMKKWKKIERNTQLKSIKVNQIFKILFYA